MKKILIVEDELVIAADLKMKLTALDYEVTDTVFNGDRVEEAVSKNTPDLLMLDIHIDGSKDGIDIAHWCNTQKLPFVFVTSYSDQDTIAKIKKVNPAGYLVKPFSKEDIKVLLEMAFFRIEQNNAMKFPDLQAVNAILRQNLTQHEWQIVLDIYEGLTNSQIANKHFVSVNTIKTHIRNIYKKCNANSKPDLIKQIIEMT